MKAIAINSTSINIRRPLMLLWITTTVAIESGFSQSPQSLKVEDFCRENQHRIVREFVSFLSIPNVASDTLNIMKNAELIMEMMRARKISNVRMLKPSTTGAPPAVYGEVLTPGAKQTLIFYAHYDGQPVNASQWAKGLAPFSPRLLSNSLLNNGQPIEFPAEGQQYEPEWRIYARGSSDDKAGVVAILNAYEAVAKNNLKLNYNIRFFFEGEEEAGSPHLHEILERHKSVLQSDLWIICDGPVHQTGKKVISFGVRGDAHLDLTVYGPKRPLHSGHYGNWAPNPAMTLAKLLSSMKDDSGKVTIKGFYDDVKPLTDVEIAAISQMPDIDSQMKKELGISSTEMQGKSLPEAISLPSLNINGMQSGNVGALASNVIPTTATAVIDLRLVLGNDWKRQQQKVIDHIRSQGFEVTDHEPTEEERQRSGKLIKVIQLENGYNAQRTPMDLPIAKKVIEAVKSTTSDQVVLVPTSGGSLPLYLFEKYLSANTIAVPVVNHDNNQHAENENIRLSNLFSGIKTIAAVMTMK
jgi:acetylornithine deacetylase/succinyl-diaminopimelate desuccinylase-like protein